MLRGLPAVCSRLSGRIVSRYLGIGTLAEAHQSVGGTIRRCELRVKSLVSIVDGDTDACGRAGSTRVSNLKPGCVVAPDVCLKVQGVK